jgi:single-strand DNA-binding protein|tara:strand:+ start:104 stop:511 length:408 start_codon:yes stop_codon:yes gene_type:complete
MLNKVMLIGNLGADPELRQTTSGQSVCELRIATNESWFDKATQTRKDRTEWHRVIVWGVSGENCAKYLSKGSKAYVEGRIQTREWEDQSGAKRYTTEIIAGSVQFLSSKGGGGGRQEQSPTPKQGGSFSDDEIPF